MVTKNFSKRPVDPRHETPDFKVNIRITGVCVDDDDDDDIQFHMRIAGDKNPVIVTGALQAALEMLKMQEGDTAGEILISTDFKNFPNDSKNRISLENHAHLSIAEMFECRVEHGDEDLTPQETQELFKQFFQGATFMLAAMMDLLGDVKVKKSVKDQIDRWLEECRQTTDKLINNGSCDTDEKPR
jgi:hypothetical protein